MHRSAVSPSHPLQCVLIFSVCATKSLLICLMIDIVLCAAAVSHKVESLNEDDPLQEAAFTYMAKYAVSNRHELLQLVRDACCRVSFVFLAAVH